MNTQLITTDNHKSINFTNDIVSISKPLFETTPINFFNFIRIYFDGKRLSLGTRADWLRHYFNNQYQNLTFYNNSDECLDNKFLGHFTNPKNPVINDAMQNFNIHNGLALIQKHDDYVDYFHFATSEKNQSILNFYFNKYDLLERFSFYFKEKASDIIIEAEPYVPIKKPNLYDNKSVIPKNIDNDDIQKFIDNTTINTIEIIADGRIIHINRTEYLSLFLTLRGYSSKEISTIINKSHRTIETYFLQLKKKLKAHSRREVIKILDNNGLWNFANNKYITK
ncbi:MAG: helix-turn-helix transcriptional regulator [Flavobacteriales bacterium]|nr:helix-turn-helix transcriptional regulator [Flavobacteriales bacterium]